jgi:BirA family biotin operon repressor/biotin-[acetyl-CoA-carboxylase] ligase
MKTAELAARLREVKPPLAENLVVLDTTTSTNDVARGILAALPPELRVCDLLVVAGRQTRGRGREERGWWSPRGGGLYATLVGTIEASGDLPRVPLAVAVGLCSAVRRAGVADCRVKWPNDLVVAGQKLAGILIEVAGPTTGACCAVMGFGINLDPDPVQLARIGGTSLGAQCSEPPDIASLAIDAVRAVRRELAAVREDSGLVDRYRDLIAHQSGDRLIWRQGSEVVEGYYRGIDASGFLELETESGLRVVNAGEIIIR